MSEERVNDELLSKIARDFSNSAPGWIAVELLAAHKRIVELEEQRRESDKYLQHLPGCQSLNTKCRVCGGRGIIEEEDGTWVCPCYEHGGNDPNPKPCTCGHDKIPFLKGK